MYGGPGVPCEWGTTSDCLLRCHLRLNQTFFSLSPSPRQSATTPGPRTRDLPRPPRGPNGILERTLVRGFPKGFYGRNGKPNPFVHTLYLGTKFSRYFLSSARRTHDQNRDGDSTTHCDSFSDVWRYQGRSLSSSPIPNPYTSAEMELNDSRWYGS